MNFNDYIVTLTNGTINNTYKIQAFNKEQATILAQAEAIKQARGYELVSIKLKEEYECLYDGDCYWKDIECNCKLKDISNCKYNKK